MIKDLNPGEFYIMGTVIALMLMGTVFDVVLIITALNYVTPFLLIIILVLAAMGGAKHDKLKEWQSTGNTDTPPDFGYISPKRDPLFYKLVHVFYLLIVILLTIYGHLGLAVLWAIIWAAVKVSHMLHAAMCDMLPKEKE